MRCSACFDDSEANPGDTGSTWDVRVLLSAVVSFRNSNAVDSHAFGGSYEDCRSGHSHGTDRRRDCAVWLGTVGDSSGHSVPVACDSGSVGRAFGTLGCYITIGSFTGRGGIDRLSYSAGDVLGFGTKPDAFGFYLLSSLCMK